MRELLAAGMVQPQTVVAVALAEVDRLRAENAALRARAAWEHVLCFLPVHSANGLVLLDVRQIESVSVPSRTPDAARGCIVVRTPNCDRETLWCAESPLEIAALLRELPGVAVSPIHPPLGDAAAC